MAIQTTTTIQITSNGDSMMEIALIGFNEH
jgi:hypothetical protein